MKLICDGLELSDAIGKVSKALPQRVVNPVLEGIKITAEGETLTLYATDSEFSVERKINAEIGQLFFWVGKLVFVVNTEQKLNRAVEIIRQLDYVFERRHKSCRSRFPMIYVVDVVFQFRAHFFGRGSGVNNQFVESF